MHLWRARFAWRWRGKTRSAFLFSWIHFFVTFLPLNPPHSHAKWLRINASCHVFHQKRFLANTFCIFEDVEDVFGSIFCWLLPCFGTWNSTLLPYCKHVSHFSSIDERLKSNILLCSSHFSCNVVLSLFFPFGKKS